MTVIPRRLLIVLLACQVLMRFQPAFADIVGSATTILNVDPAGHMTGTTTFLDQTRNVFGTTVNLGSAGTLTLTGQVTSLTPGTFTLRTVGSGCSSCSSTCQSCQSSCTLCYTSSGNFGTDASGETFFLGGVFNLTGTVVAGLLPNLVYQTEGAGTGTGTPAVTPVHFETTPYAFNAFQPVGTQTGSNQTVPTSTTFLDSSTDLETPVVVDVTYANVNAAGTTTVTAASAALGTLPNVTTDIGLCSKDKKLACTSDADCPEGQTCAGYHGFFFDTTTTAGVTPPFTVCSHYQDAEAKPKGKGGNGYVDGTGKPGLPEANLRLLHDDGSGTFVDVTLPGYPDTVNNIVCGQTNSLSNFVPAVTTDMAGGGAEDTDCWTEFALCPPGQTGGGNVKLPKKKKGKVAVTEAAMTCSAGRDAKCKGTAGMCTFCVRICANRNDYRLPTCVPQDVQGYLLSEPQLVPGSQDNDSINAGRILDGLQTLGAATVFGSQVTYQSPVTADVCSDPIQISLPVNLVTRKVKLRASTASGKSDTDTLSLLCKP